MKNKKIYLFLLMFFAFILFFNINTSKAHIIEKYDLINETFGNYGWVFYKGTDDNYYLAVGNYAIKNCYADYSGAYAQLSGNRIRFSHYESGSSHYYGTTIYQVDSNYNFTKGVQYSWESTAPEISKIIDIHLKNPITNGGTTIYYTVSEFEEDVVDPFQMTPLSKVMFQEMEQKATVKEILGILPLIIVVVVSLVGLRKGLRMLLNFLKMS